MSELGLREASGQEKHVTLGRCQYAPQEYNDCLGAFCDRYHAIFGVDPRVPDTSLVDECLGVTGEPSCGPQLGAGLWGDRLVKRLHDMCADYEDVFYTSSGLTDGSVYHRQQRLDVFESGILERGFWPESLP